MHTQNCRVLLCHYEFRHLRSSCLLSESGFGGHFWSISWGLFGWGRFLLFFIPMIFPFSHLEIHLYSFGFSAYSSPFGSISWNQSLSSFLGDFPSHLGWDRRHNHGAKPRSSPRTTHTGQHNLSGPALLTQSQRAHPAFSKANNIPRHKAGCLLVLSKCESQPCPRWQRAQYKQSQSYVLGKC